MRWTCWCRRTSGTDAYGIGSASVVVADHPRFLIV
jgi:hypothetical protein